MENKLNLTPREIAHYVTLFFYNWEENDFREAYKNSKIGETYVWDKLQYKINEVEMDSTAALLDVFLNLHSDNQDILIDYILNKKYTQSILKQREWNNFLDNAEFEDCSTGEKFKMKR